MTKNISTILTEAKAKIADEANWIKNAFGIQHEGRDCYCSAGAIEFEFATDGRLHAVVQVDELGWTTRMAAMELLAKTIRPGDSYWSASWIYDFNDAPDTTHADVMDAFDRAIETARRQERIEAAKAKLVEGKARIATEDTWIKNEFARKVDGQACFCARGAVAWDLDERGVQILRPGYYGEAQTYADADECLEMAVPSGFFSVPEYNDHPSTTHADVLRMFDLAIQLADEGAFDK